MILDCINGIIEILQNNDNTSAVNDVIDDLCNIIQSEIEGTFDDYDVLIIDREMEPTIEIINKQIINSDLYVKIKIKPNENGFLISIAHDWIKFKDTTKFVGHDIIETLSNAIKDMPKGYIKLNNYYGSSCWDDIDEVHIISKFHNMIIEITEDEIIDELDNVLNIYNDLLIDYDKLEQFSLLDDIEEIFKNYPREKEEFPQTLLGYEMITYIKYDFIETIRRAYNGIPSDLRISLSDANDEYALTPNLSMNLNHISSSLFYRNGLIFGVTFQCDERIIKFYISQDLNRINNAMESNKIGKRLIEILKEDNADCDYVEIDKTDRIKAGPKSREYDVFRFHWVCSKSYSFDELNDRELFIAFNKFMKIYDSITQYYKYLRGSYDLIDAENNRNLKD